MKFEIDQKDKKFNLKVDDAPVFEADKLSDIVRKIEAYVKLRFLPEPVKLGFMDRVKVMTSGVAGGNH